MTNQYNEALREHLPEKGVEFYEIPRLEQDAIPVSASGVRAALENKDYAALENMVPKTTFDYLKTKGFMK